ncbi:MAG: peptidyl-prolyl cis-trans isomerase [Myxococcota bacterium]|nr:peptidyl-prolyl cis-trans isomerase [Myxococcota bacterium]
MSRLGIGLCLTLVAAPLLGAGCKKSEAPAPAASASAASPAASAAAFELSDEQAAQVLAKVGEHTITLGDYVAALERMDTFERLRYQSADRRKLLLKEMIDVQLLADEAKRRGLDKLPETEERLRQVLRDELMKEVRRSVPSASDLPEADVRKYYDEHREEFSDPERRRVSHIAAGNRAAAEKLLEKAKAASAAEWGAMVRENSITPVPKELGSMPVELAGDLGIVGPPGHPRGANPRVSEAVRAAAFKIEKTGDVLPEVVEDKGKFEIVRLTAITPARDRTFAESERSIRVTLVQQLVKQKEAELDKELRARFPVTIDEAALGRIQAKPPAPAKPAPPRKTGG